MKKGYWVVRAKLIDNEAYSKYINLATKSIKKYGGQFIVRGGHQKEFECLLQLFLGSQSSRIVLKNQLKA